MHAPPVSTFDGQVHIAMKNLLGAGVDWLLLLFFGGGGGGGGGVLIMFWFCYDDEVALCLEVLIV